MRQNRCKSDAETLCLITPGHIGSTPRLVKNANALVEAGFRVHVVAGRYFPPAEKLDAAILADSTWKCTRVRMAGGPVGFFHRIRSRVSRISIAVAPSLRRLAAHALHRDVLALVRAATSVRSRLYFAHGGVIGLAVASSAAQRQSAQYAFDAEDWHEEDSIQPDSGCRMATRSLLRQHLSAAEFVTCSAPLIAVKYARTYHVDPVCILNVFPRAEAPPAPNPPSQPTPTAPARLYWFSQTIGPNRGLEPMLEVLGRLQTPAVLHLRGFCGPDYRERLTARAAAVGARPPVFLTVGDPAEMARLAAGAHLGLSLESREPVNRDLCLTNKIFTYLLAGVPVALTPTKAQQALAPELGAAAIMVDLTTPQATASLLDHWFAGATREPARTAWRLGCERFNWDREKQVLLQTVCRSLSQTGS